MPKHATVFVGPAGGALIKAGVLISIGDVNRTKEMIEDDDMESVESGYARKSPGLKSVDDLSMVIRHKKGDAGQTALDTSFSDDSLIDFEIRYPDAEKTCIAGTGYVSGISLSSQDKSSIRIERSITISISGDLTETTWTEDS